MVLNFRRTMKNNHFLLIPLLFLTAVSLLLPGEEDFSYQNRKQYSKVKTERLVRMDLIESIKKDFEPPLRNIFTFQHYSQGDASEGKEEESFTQISGESRDRRESQNRTDFFLEYVGYIKSKDKMVALIIFQGRALAVQEGELLEDGSVVALVSEESIEVTGTSSQKSTFYLKEENR